MPTKIIKKCFSTKNSQHCAHLFTTGLGAEIAATKRQKKIKKSKRRGRLSLLSAISEDKITHTHTLKRQKLKLQQINTQHNTERIYSCFSLEKKNEATQKTDDDKLRQRNKQQDKKVETARKQAKLKGKLMTSSYLNFSYAAAAARPNLKLCGR